MKVQITSKKKVKYTNKIKRKKMARKSKLEAKKEEIATLLNEGAYVDDIAKTVGFSVAAIYEYIQKFHPDIKKRPVRGKLSKLRLSGKNEQIREMLATEATMDSIAETLGLHKQTLYKYTKEISPDNAKNRRLQHKERIKKRIKELLDTQMRVEDIAKTLNMSASPIYKYIRQFKVNYKPIRNKRNDLKSEKRKQQIKELLATGAKRMQIAKILNMSTGRIDYYIKLMKDESANNK